MKSIKTLLKIKDKEVNEIKNHLLILENKKDLLEDNINKLKEEISQEELFVNSQPDFLDILDNFKKISQAKINKIQNDIELLNSDIEKNRDILFDLFGEMKKLEVILNNQVTKEKNKEQSELTKIMDEIGIRSFTNPK